ncbi:MAG: RluA family pseudouridine synthase [Candidatus Sumerlaeaceae bacterium]|nr:RluA family pseudouridine synthase [Candidatus Sumerlaeaceae bacterium]
MAEPQTIEVTEEDAGQRLDVFVAAQFEELSRTQAQRLIDSGNVTVASAVEKASYTVQAGDSVTVQIPEPEAAEPLPESIPIEVVFEDDDLLVINKAPGIAVHPGAGVTSGTLVNALLGRGRPLSAVGGVLRPGIVHRLDKDTSGLLLVAKNDFSHHALSAALAKRDISRVYHAIVLRIVKTPSGEIDAPLGRHPTQRQKMAVVANGGRDAKTFWKLLESYAGLSLVECRLATGRTHQIRVHLSHIGHPVLGDAMYGGGSQTATKVSTRLSPATRRIVIAAGRQMLHARQLSFVHPRTGKEMAFVANPPADFIAVVHALRQG